MKEKPFIGRVARMAGVSVQAVRFYEQLGLLPATQRTPGGYRIYGPESVDRLQFVKQAQELGFSLDEIREILRLKYEGRSPCACVSNLLQKKLEKIEHDIRQLVRFRRELRKTLERSKQLPHLPHKASSICPLIQVESRQSGKEEKRGKRR
jgi:MerR family copper efflux transcriptional regulator